MDEEVEKEPIGVSVVREGQWVVIRLVRPCEDVLCEDYGSGDCYEVESRIDVDPEFARELAFKLTTASYEPEG